MIRLVSLVALAAALSLEAVAINGLSQAPADSNKAPQTEHSKEADLLPEGPGKEQVKKICTGCHSLKTVTSKHQSADAWEQTVEQMVSKGANGSDEDIEKVEKYLSVHFGPTTDGPTTNSGNSSPK